MFMKCQNSIVKYSYISIISRNKATAAVTIAAKKYVSDDSVQESTYIQEPAKSIDDGVETIMEQTECNRATAIKALHAENNDVISCIMNIDQYRVDDNKDAKPAEEESVSLEVEE